MSVMLAGHRRSGRCARGKCSTSDCELIETLSLLVLAQLSLNALSLWLESYDWMLVEIDGTAGALVLHMLSSFVTSIQVVKIRCGNVSYGSLRL